MKHILTLFLLLAISTTYSQKKGQNLIDSLNIELQHATSDSIQQNIFAKLGWPYTMTGKIDSAIYAAQNSLRLATQLNNTYGIADAHNDLGNIYNLIGHYPDAIRSFLTTIQLLEFQKDKKSKTLIGWAYSNLSESYLKWGNDEEAYKYINIALKYKQETGDCYWLASSYYNLGDYFLKKNRFDEALNSYKNGLKVANEVNNTHHHILGHLGIGEIYRKNGLLDNAILSFDSALTISVLTDEKFNVSQCYQKIGEIYNLKDQPIQAINWLQKSITIGREISALEILKNAYHSLVTSYQLLNQHSKALECYSQYVFFKDSLYNVVNSNKIATLQMNHEIQKKQDAITAENDKQLAIKDATLQASRREKIFYIFGIALLGFLTVMLYRQSKVRKNHNLHLLKLNEDLAIANKTKTQFFNILNHDLRSPVANLIHFLHLKSNKDIDLHEKDWTRLEKKTIHNVENLLRTMEDLLYWSKGQMENFKPFFEMIDIDQLFQDNQDYFFDVEHINITHKNSHNLSIYSDYNYLKTILRNLTSNAINALRNTSHPQISWTASKDSNEQVVLIITDNGPGAHLDKFQAFYDKNVIIGVKSGLGLHLIRDLADAINCNINVNSSTHSGTSIYLSFPHCPNLS